MSIKKYIVFRGETVELSQGVDGLFRCSAGTVWALRDEGASLDEIDRCGIGILSLPADHILTRACRPHDYMYSSTAYQVYHYRHEADDEVARLAHLVGSHSGPALKYISKILGGWFWENDATR